MSTSIWFYATIAAYSYFSNLLKVAMKRCFFIFLGIAIALSSLQEASVQAVDSAPSLHSGRISAADLLLYPPQLLSDDEIAEGLKKQHLNMTCEMGKDSYCHFVSHHDDVYFEIALSEFPESFQEAEKALFQKETKNIDGTPQQVFTFSYRLCDTGKEMLNAPREERPPNPFEHASYTAAERRLFHDANPSTMSPDELAQVVSRYNIIFYTGAGISAASGIPTMSQLCNLLEIEADAGWPNSLKRMVVQPKRLAQNFRKFHQACFTSPSTQAHKALLRLALLKKTQVITENLDYLHEFSGILPYRINADDLKNRVEPSSVRLIDFVICIGLSCDDKGFLGWYKQHHPQGKIIAIDLQQPTYLGSEDYLVRGDLQDIVPALVSKKEQKTVKTLEKQRGSK